MGSYQGTASAVPARQARMHHVKEKWVSPVCPRIFSVFFRSVSIVVDRCVVGCERPVVWRTLLLVTDVK